VSLGVLFYDPGSLIEGIGHSRQAPDEPLGVFASAPSQDAGASQGALDRIRIYEAGPSKL
jgi:hypothetical protein